MDPEIPTSFIPKRPVTTEVVHPRTTRAVGLLSLVTAVVVIATALSFAYVYVSKRQLASQQAKLASSIDAARNTIGTEFITDMKRLNARIDGVKMIIKNHIVVSPIFAALEATTLHSVQYKNFTYAFVTDAGTKVQSVQVTLTGSAKSYATIALQSDAFTSNPFIKNPVFSNLSVNDKTNVVDFRLVFTVDPAELSYEKFIAKTTTVQSNQPTP